MRITRPKIRNWRLKYKILFSFLIVSIIPIMAASYIQYKESSKYILKLEQDSLSVHAEIIRKQIDLYFDDMKNVTMILSLNQEITDLMMDKRKPEEMVDQVNSLLDSTKRISDHEYSAIFVLDIDGVCSASTDRRFIKTDYSFRPYYRNIVNIGNTFYISNFSIGLRSLIPGVFISAPIKNSNHELIGVMVLKVAGAAIWQLIEDFSRDYRLRIAGNEDPSTITNVIFNEEKHIKPYPEVYLVNQDGIIISHREKELVYKSLDTLSEETVDRIILSRQFLEKKIESINNPVLKELHEEAVNNKKPAARTYFYNNSWNVIAISPLENKSWSAGVSQSYSEFSFLVRILFNKMTILSCLFIAGIILLALLISKIITQPMAHLISVIKELGNKKWSARADVKSHDEFGLLGRQFNQLIDIIEEYSENLEAKVIKRTEEITRLEQENLRLRIIEEKEHIYGDLHDSLGARLTNIFICNDVAQSVSGKNELKLSNMLERIESNCQMAISDLQDIILDNEDKSEKITDFSVRIMLNIERRLKLKNINFNYSINNQKKLNCMNNEIKFEIEKLLQELVSNVLKHSSADQVICRLNEENSLLTIDFEDNGVGFQVGVVSDRSFGLNNIYHRIERMGGTVKLSSIINSGSVYRIKIPV